MCRVPAPSPSQVPAPSPNPAPAPSPITKTTTTSTTSTTTTTTTTTSTTSNLECTEEWVDQYRGKSETNTHRVVGGSTVTDPKEWPWSVAVGSDCGGAIITCQHVLTALHCVVGKQFVVMMNSTESNQTTIAFNHTNILVPNDTNGNFTWLNKNYIADVAIIKLENKLSRKDVIEGFMRPIRLPTSGLSENDTYWVIGYGGNPSLSNYQLHETDKLKLQAEANCDGVPTVLPFQPEADLCIKTTGPPSDPVSNCRGDSGSPGMIKDGDRWYAQGVVSRIGGNGSCVIGAPLVHVAVHKKPVLDWINDNIK